MKPVITIGQQGGDYAEALAIDYGINKCPYLG